MQPVTVIRVDKATIIIFLIIFLPCLCIGGALLWHSAHIGEGIVFCIGYVLLVYWVCSPSIELSPGYVGYRTLFRQSEIDLATVSHVFTRANPAPTLMFRQKDGNIVLKFLVKPFSRNGLVALFHHIRQSNPEIHFDQTSEHMSRADFGPLTREAVAAANLLRIALMVGMTTLGASLIKLLLMHR